MSAFEALGAQDLMAEFSQLFEISNLAVVSVSKSYSSTDTSVTLNTGAGASLPDTRTANDFYLVWYDATNFESPSDDPLYEVVLCTERVGDVLTVLRGQDGTDASRKDTAGATYQMILCNTRAQFETIDKLLSWAINPTALKFGAKFDGLTDDSAAVHQAILAAQAGQPVIFPAGVCSLSSWPVAGRHYAKSLKLIGLGKSSVIKGRSNCDFLDVSQDLSIDGVKFESWRRGIKLDSIASVVGDVEIRNSFSNECVSIVSWEKVHNTALIQRLRIDGNSFENFSGEAINIRGYFDTASVSNNVVDGSKDQGIRLGDDDPANEDRWKNIRVFGNTVSNVAQAEDASSGADSYGILIYGQHATIEGNTVDGVVSGTGITSEATGLYTKCRHTSIVGNSVANVRLRSPGRSTSHAWGIEVKGSDREAKPQKKPHGYGCMVVGNTVTFSDPGRSRGIRVANGEVIVDSNFVDGSDDHGIQIGADGRATRHVICKGNLVRTTATEGVESQGIRINSEAGDIGIDGNSVWGACRYGIVVDPSAGALKNLSLVNNRITSLSDPAATGIHFRPKRVTLDNVRVEGNEIEGSCAEGIATRGVAIARLFVSKNVISGARKEYNFSTLAQNLHLDVWPSKDGKVTIASDAVKVIVKEHGFPIAPKASQIHLSPTSTPSENPGPLSVQKITASSFEIHCHSAPGSDWTIDWAIA